MSSDESSDPPMDEPDVAAERSRLPGLLVAAATFLAIVAVFSTWVRTQALDTDEWVQLSADLIDEPEVTEALSAFLVDEIYESTDVPEQFETLLPENLEGLAGPLAAAARQPATDNVERLLQSEQFRTLWTQTNRLAHENAVAVLRDDTGPVVSTAEGQITLELGEMLGAAGERLGLASGLLDDAPEDAGRIILLDSDELASAQRAVAVLEFLTWFLFLVVVALYGLAVYLAPGRRLAVLRSVGFGLVAAGLIVLIVRAIAIRLVVEAIVDDPLAEPVANVTAYVMTGLLRQIAWSGVISGGLILLFTVLMGAGKRATAIRRVLAPGLNASVGAVAAGTALLVLLLVWWSPGRTFSGWVTGLVLVALVVGAVIALRTQTKNEFPTATFHDVAESVVAWAGNVRHRSAAETETPRSSEMVTNLESLRALHADGGLTDDEFETAKNAVLS